MNRLLLAVCVAVSLVLGACSHQGIRPPPRLGKVEDVHTEDGDYDGYSVSRRFDVKETSGSTGYFGTVTIQGHGQRPIVVRPRPKRDEEARRMAPTLRISTLTGFEDARVEEAQANHVVGLDYAYMREQGWLYERCRLGSEGLCSISGRDFETPSFLSLDALIAYLGRWLKEGDYEGDFRVSVWRHPGGPEQVTTRMGTYEGYSVEWCRPEVNDWRVVVLTPTHDADASDEKQRYPLHGQSSPGCHSRFATIEFVDDFGQLDEAIAQFGRTLRDGALSGEVLLIVQSPDMPFMKVAY